MDIAREFVARQDWSQFVPDLLVAIVTGVAVGLVLLAFERRRNRQDESNRMAGRFWHLHERLSDEIARGVPWADGIGTGTLQLNQRFLSHAEELIKTSPSPGELPVWTLAASQWIYEVAKYGSELELDSERVERSLLSNPGSLRDAAGDSVDAAGLRVALIQLSKRPEILSDSHFDVVDDLRKELAVMLSEVSESHVEDLVNFVVAAARTHAVIETFQEATTRANSCDHVDTLRRIRRRSALKDRRQMRKERDLARKELMEFCEEADMRLHAGINGC